MDQTRILKSAWQNVTIGHELPRNSALLEGQINVVQPKDGSENDTMEGMKATEQRQDSQSQHTELDNRYRKIGISAVAAAVRHQGEQDDTHESRLVPYDRD
jgi:hypothetical protein